jgi:hypothetical protein
MRGSARIPLSDLGELAARLGSPVTYDRRGEVVFYTQFDEGLAHLYMDGDGLGNAIALSADYPDRGSFCALLTAGSTLGHNYSIEKQFSPAALGKAGCEFSYSPFPGYDRMRISLGRFDGAHSHEAVISLSDTDSKVYYKDAAGAQQEICTLHDTVSSGNIFTVVKLVCDFYTDCYVSLQLNELFYSLKDIPLYEAVDASIHQNRTYLTFYGRDTLNDQCRLGYLILTGNEP